MKNISYSEMIKNIRESKGYSRNKVAEIIKASPKSVYNYETGQEPKDPDVARRIRELYEKGEVSEDRKSTDYKDRVIELQEQIIKHQKSTDEIMAEISGMKLKINPPVHTYQSLMSIDTKLSALIGMFLKFLSNDDESKMDLLSSELTSIQSQELKQAIDRYRKSGAMEVE